MPRLSAISKLTSSVADAGGFTGFRRTPPLRPDPGVVAESARTGCISTVKTLNALFDGERILKID